MIENNLTLQADGMPGPFEQSFCASGRGCWILRRCRNVMAALIAGLCILLCSTTVNARPANKTYGPEACAAAEQSVGTWDTILDELNDLKNKACPPPNVPPQYFDRTNIYKECMELERTIMWIQQAKSESQMVVLQCKMQELDR